ncbi:MAG: hypothetical protein K6G23_09690 [Lachnospiraceae bacterium]|nr:hypothetical protein [Lachnospiraceae bacterium]
MGFWKSFIPQKVNHRLMLHVYDAWSYLTFFTGEEIAEIERENVQRLLAEDSPLPEMGYIENQKQWMNIRYGKTDMAFAGCEIMAAWNAMKALGIRTSAYDIAGMISYFTKKGAVRGGKFGTSPLAVRRYLNENGYPVTTVRKVTTENLSELQEKADVFIAVVYNDAFDIMAQVHTVCITKEKGGYRTHNRTGQILNTVRRAEGASLTLDHEVRTAQHPSPDKGSLSDEITMPTLYEAVTRIREKCKPICVFGIIDTCAR